MWRGKGDWIRVMVVTNVLQYSAVKKIITLHSQWSIPRYDGRTDPQGLAESIGHASRDVQRLAVNLVCPPCVVPDGRHGLRHIQAQTVRVQNAAFQRLDGCEFLCVPLDQTRQFVEQRGALGPRGGFPCGEGGRRCLDCAVDVLRAGCGDVCEGLTGGGILDGQSGIVGRGGEFVVDEEGGWDCRKSVSGMSRMRS